MWHGRMIFILGDVHRDFKMLNKFIDGIRHTEMLSGMADFYRQNGDDYRIIILQCGDFAYYWPLGDRVPIDNEIDWLEGGRVPIYWTGGNHEDWDRLDALGPEISEVRDGVFYCPFGTTLEIKSDLTVLFAGGAESHDKKARLDEMERGAPKIWWEQEGISDADMKRLDSVPKADWVISHTAPNIFDVEKTMENVWGHVGKFRAPSRGKLEQVFVKYHPKRWYFGHFHSFMKGRTDGCDWEGLADLRSIEQFWAKKWIERED